MVFAIDYTEGEGLGFKAMAGESSLSSDEDEEHNAALRSVAVDSDAVLQFAKPSVHTSGRKSRLSKVSGKRSARVLEEDDEDDDGDGTGGLKLYQTRVQDLLHKHLDKVFEESRASVPVQSENGSKSPDPVAEDEDYDGEIRLFNNAPLGVALKKSRPSMEAHVRRLPPRYNSSDEDEAEQGSRLRAAAVEAYAVKSQAEKAQAIALSRFIAGEEAAQRAEKAEVERLRHLRQKRGEEWLPSVAKENMKEIREQTERRKAMSSASKIGVVANYKV